MTASFASDGVHDGFKLPIGVAPTLPCVFGRSGGEPTRTQDARSGDDFDAARSRLVAQLADLDARARVADEEARLAAKRSSAVFLQMAADARAELAAIEAAHVAALDEIRAQARTARADEDPSS